MKARFLFVVGIMAALGLSGCGSSGSPYGGSSDPTAVKIGKPYSVSGQTYYPKYEPGYSETGVASWYGPDFHERMTASGEQYNQDEYTAAHKTLPMPSMVRVTRLDNGRSVEVRVNDRGPFVNGRIIDLSKAAAKAIGLDISGTTMVRVEYLPQETDSYISSLNLKAPWWGESQITTAAVPAPEVNVSDMASPTISTQAVEVSDNAAPAIASPQPLAAPQPLIAADTVAEPQPVVASPPVIATPVAVATIDNSPAAIAKPAQMEVKFTPAAPAATPKDFGKTAYRVQAGSFANYQNAEHLADGMANIASPEIRETLINGKTFYRVSLGPVYDLSAAQIILNKAKELGHSDARLIVE